MRTSWLWLSSCILLQRTAALSLPHKRDADFESVRLLSRLDRPYVQSQKDSSQTYFQQSSFSNQYDGRFGNQELSAKYHHINLVALVQSYLISMNDLGVPTWLVHETLLSWYLDRKLRPGQNRVDVMVSSKSMQFLADSCNMTVYRYKPEGFAKSRNYLLEVSPFWNESRGLEADARWIDTFTGLYIDLMTPKRTDAVKDGVDGEETNIDSSRAYALQETVFEGVPARVPAGYASMLRGEHGHDALSPSPPQTH